MRRCAALANAHPALAGLEYAALVESPRALRDGLILVFNNRLNVSFCVMGDILTSMAMT